MKTVFQIVQAYMARTTGLPPMNAVVKIVDLEGREFEVMDAAYLSETNVLHLTINEKEN